MASKHPLDEWEESELTLLEEDDYRRMGVFEGAGYFSSSHTKDFIFLAIVCLLLANFSALFASVAEARAQGAVCHGKEVNCLRGKLRY